MFDSEPEGRTDDFAFTVEPDEIGRLDVIVAARLESVSRSRIRRWIDSGHVTVDGAVVRAGRKLGAGQRVEVTIPEAAPSELVAEPIPIEILYEDESIIVVNKPAGLIVHPGAGNPSGTLANGLLHHFRSLSREGSLRPGIVHRLDRDTSGVMVIAKSEAAHEALSAQFARRQVEKEYTALLYGVMKESEGTIDIPIGRDRRDRLRVSNHTSKPRDACTRYRLIRRLSEFTLVSAFPKTGRTHQIRVHFKLVNHPVVGDALYDSGRLNSVTDKRAAAAIRRLQRHFLHASRLAFEHPDTARRVEFRTALPTELEELLVTL